MASKKKLLQAAAGSAGGAGLDVDEVFSTYLYDGTGSAQTITNGIDHTAENTLVWTKTRSSNQYGHRLIDEGNSLILSSDVTNGALNGNLSVSQYYLAGQSNGFRLLSAEFNVSGQEYVSWTFRKAPKFFDVIDHTQTGSEPSTVTLNHNLGCDVGMIIAKVYSHTNAWVVWHKDLGSNYAMDFSTGAKSYFGGTGISTSSTQITIPGSWVHAGYDSQNTIIYLFAHNNSDGGFGPDSDKDIIKCGSYAGNGNDARTIDLGFEAQWVLLKRYDGATDWWILDNMRGLHARQIASNYLEANTSNAEASTGAIFADEQGFMVDAGDYNSAGENYIYMAIRRGPLAEPENATDVFAIDDVSNGASEPDSISGFPVDFVLRRYINTNNNWVVCDRLRNHLHLKTNSTDAEAALNSNTTRFDYMNGVNNFFSSNNTNFYHWMWKRAPSYFDVVAWTGNDTAGRTVAHNLGVVPEMIWVKNRSAAVEWVVYHKDVSNGFLKLNTNDAKIGAYVFGADSSNDAQSATNIFLSSGNGVNELNKNYIGYLFATVAGVSKVGSYTGNGSSSGPTVDCGFSGSPRFVLIKKATGGTGSWYVFDSVRGIVAGAESQLYLNNTAAEQTATDQIDPTSSGFQIVINSGGLNTNGETYIFYAIA